MNKPPEPRALLNPLVLGPYLAVHQARTPLCAPVVQRADCKFAGRTGISRSFKNEAPSGEASFVKQ
jgi:hypothetical protein